MLYATTAVRKLSAHESGQLCFDKFNLGSGGVYSDGRYQSGAKAIIALSNLSAGDRVLAVGCVKGFLSKGLVVLAIDAFIKILCCYPLRTWEASCFTLV